MPNKRRMVLVCVSKSCWDHSMENARHFSSEVVTCFLRKLKCEVVFLLSKSDGPCGCFLKRKANKAISSMIPFSCSTSLMDRKECFLKHKANRAMFIHTRC